MYRALAIIVGWSIFAFLAYNASTNAVENKIYDPFEILGLRSVRSAGGIIPSTYDFDLYFLELKRERNPFSLQKTLKTIVRPIHYIFLTEQSIQHHHDL
jgi:hypothetical protein